MINFCVYKNWNDLSKKKKYQRNQIKSCQSEIHRKYFLLSFLAVRSAGTAQINPHRNNVPRGQDLARVSSPHFMKTGIIQSRGFTENMWAAAKDQRSRDSRRQPSQTRPRGKHWEERKEKRGRVEDLTVNSFFHTQKTVISQPCIALSFPVLQDIIYKWRKCAVLRNHKEVKPHKATLLK